jgi:hypothetical protein
MGNGIGYTAFERGYSKKAATKKSSKKGSKKNTNYYDEDYYHRGNSGGYYDREYYNNPYYQNNWSWGSFGGSSTLEDNDSGLYVKSHESYFTPTHTEIMYRLNGSNNTYDNRNLVKEMARFFYYRMLGEKDYFETKYKDLTKLSESDIVALSSKKKFYNDLWDKYIPGMSPLEKAIAVINELTDLDPKLDVKQAQNLDRALEKMRFDEKTYGDPIYNELLDVSELKNRKMNILSKISMVQNLGSEFKIEKEVEEKVVDNSRILAQRIMRDYSQIANVQMYQRLLPNFNSKLITKDLVVDVHVDKTEHKQKIIMLLDYSGSMNQVDKQEWVVAIMLDRLRHAIKEEAEIFFSYFLHSADSLKFTHIYNRDTAIEFWSKFSTRPSGGETRLGDMVNRIGQDIKGGKWLVNLPIDLSKDMPEILAINDGQDSIKTQNFTYKTNAISLFQDNGELRDLCIKNKGKYVVANTDSMTTYDGKSVLKIKH